MNGFSRELFKLAYRDDIFRKTSEDDDRYYLEFVELFTDVKEFDMSQLLDWYCDHQFSYVDFVNIKKMLSLMQKYKDFLNNVDSLKSLYFQLQEIVSEADLEQLNNNFIKHQEYYQRYLLIKDDIDIIVDTRDQGEFFQIIQPKTVDALKVLGPDIVFEKDPNVRLNYYDEDMQSIFQNELPLETIIFVLKFSPLKSIFFTVGENHFSIGENQDMSSYYYAEELFKAKYFFPILMNTHGNFGESLKETISNIAQCSHIKTNLEEIFFEIDQCILKRFGMDHYFSLYQITCRYQNTLLKDKLEILAAQNGGSLNMISPHNITLDLCIDSLKFYQKDDNYKKMDNPIEYIPEHFLSRELYAMSMDTEAYSISVLPKEFWDEDMLAIKLKRNGLVLKDIPDSHKTRHLIEIAIMENPQSACFVKKEFWDKELILILKKSIQNCPRNKNIDYMMDNIPMHLLSEIDEEMLFECLARNPFRYTQLETLEFRGQTIKKTLKEKIITSWIDENLVNFSMLPASMKTQENYEKIVEHDGKQWDRDLMYWNTSELFQKSLRTYPRNFYFVKIYPDYQTIENLKIALEHLKKSEEDTFYSILENFPQEEFDKISDEEGINLCIKALRLNLGDKNWIPNRYRKDVYAIIRQDYWNNSRNQEMKSYLRNIYQTPLTQENNQNYDNLKFNTILIYKVKVIL